MHEPVFDIQLPPGTFSVRDVGHSTYANPLRLVYLLDVYESEEAQKSIAAAVATLIGRAGIDLIALEGAAGEDAFRLFRTPLELWTVHKGLAAGIDDRLLSEASGAAMDDLKKMQRVREGLFDWIREAIATAQRRVYSPELIPLRQTLTSMFAPQRTSPADQVRALTRLAGQRGLELVAFPSLTTFAATLDLEKQIDFPAVEKDRAGFVAELVNRVVQKWTPADQTLDRLLGYFCSSLRMSGEERESLRREPHSYVAFRVTNWVQQALFEGAIQMRTSGETAAARAYYAQLREVADAIRWAWRGTYPNLAKYEEYLALAAGIKTDVLVLELQNVAAYVVQQTGTPEEKAFFDAETRLGALYRALCVEMAPGDAEFEDISPGALIRALDELRLPPPPAVRSSLTQMDQALERAAVFLTSARERSAKMGRSTLEAMRRLNRRRAVLIAGGFHVRGILRQLEDQRTLSWSSLSPKLSSESMTQMGRNRGA